MKIAVLGCMRGELERTYETVAEIEERETCKIELILCCGDFESLRNIADLRCKASPDHRKEMGSFFKYYSGEKVAPVLTIFIGGNHEASNYLQELPYGGWVAPNIYYLGYAGVVEFNGFRIAGLSGIYKRYDYMKGRYESPPYDEDSKRSVYHVRNIDVFRLRQLTNGKPDIVLSHDWPCGVHKYGDADALFCQKRNFRKQVETDVSTLGSPPTWEVLETLKPDFWFSAHLHVKYAAVVEHVDGSKTKFLGLDKCLPERQFLQVLTVGGNNSNSSPRNSRLRYDPEWLAILRSTNHLVTVENKNVGMPNQYNLKPTQDQVDEVVQMLGGTLEIPENFVATEMAFDPIRDQGMLWRTPDPSPKSNQQTKWLCSKLKIDDPMDLLLAQSYQDTSSVHDDVTRGQNEVIPTAVHKRPLESSRQLNENTSE